MLSMQISSVAFQLLLMLLYAPLSVRLLLDGFLVVMIVDFLVFPLQPPQCPVVLFGLNVPRFSTWDVLFWFNNFMNNFIINDFFIPLFWSDLKSFLFVCSVWVRPTLQWAQDQMAQWFQTHHTLFPALCGQLLDHVSSHEPHPWAEVHTLLSAETTGSMSVVQTRQIYVFLEKNKS